MMQKTKLAILLLPLFTGCSTAVQHMATYYDHMDPCIMRGKPESHQRPTWCGTQATRMTITTSQGQTIGYIRR